MSTSAKQLRRIYAVIILSIIGFLAIQQYLIQLSANESNSYSIEINKAGKQRMLSQLIAKLSLQYDQGENTETELNKSLLEWNSAYNELIVDLKESDGSPLLLKNLEEIGHFHQEITENVNRLTRTQKSAERTAYLNLILKNTDLFLVKMDAIVQQYDLEAQHAIQNIRLVELSMTCIAILIILLEIFMVFRPSRKMIEGHEISLREQIKIIKNQETILQHNISELTDSLNYAKKVQEAILPTKTKFAENFQDSFILYLPKQIVAGDFYFFEEIKIKDENSDLLLIAVGDCTGHGVPGAMVSIFCHNAISKAIQHHKLKDPASILDQVNKYIKNEFTNGKKEMSDGMDITFCYFNRINNQLSWSGANIPLWIVRQHEKEKEFIELKPDKQPIGNYVTNKQFTNHVITLQDNDVIYLFSDGYRDQFGGERGKKLTRKHFQKIIMEMDNSDLSITKIALNNSLYEWMGDHEQVDDITVIGVKFNMN